MTKRIQAGGVYSTTMQWFRKEFPISFNLYITRESALTLWKTLVVILRTKDTQKKTRNVLNRQVFVKNLIKNIKCTEEREEDKIIGNINGSQQTQNKQTNPQQTNQRQSKEAL